MLRNILINTNLLIEYGPLVAITEGVLQIIKPYKSKDDWFIFDRTLFKDYTCFSNFQIKDSFDKLIEKGILKVKFGQSRKIYLKLKERPVIKEPVTPNRVPEKRIYCFNGEVHSLSQWSKILGINIDTLHRRIHRQKWPIEKAFTKEVIHRK